MLQLFTSAKPISLYIVCHGPLGVLINIPPTPSLLTICHLHQDSIAKHVFDMPQHVQDGNPLWRKMCKTHPLTHKSKNAGMKVNLKCPEQSHGHLHPYSTIASLIENCRGFGSYLFIYFKPSCLSLSSQEPVTLA